jgi:hypothetical protein
VIQELPGVLLSDGGVLNQLIPPILSAVEEQLSRQFEALRARVEQSGLYTHEIEEYALACQAYREIIGPLQVSADLGSVTSSESRNLVRKVRRYDAGLAVLKVMGNTREPGEGEVLASWHRLGLPCVEPLEWGYQQVSAPGQPNNRTTAYVLTRFVEGQPLRKATSREEGADLVTRLIDLVQPFHFSGAAVSRTRTWAYRVGLHLKWTMPLIRCFGLSEPRLWQDKLRRVSDDGDTLVHGDPAGANVLDTDDGNLILLDPPGALRAMREADIGQICSQVGGVEHSLSMIEVALEADRTLDPGALACFAGINFLIWSGYFLVEHQNPDAIDSAGQAMESAVAYLKLAARLFDEFHLD